jgi:hypothetical protein
VRNLLNGMEFEDILQYVQIPSHPYSSHSGSKSSKEDSTLRKMEDVSDSGVGREDFKLIFDTLITKGVNKIVKLVVDDDETYPHRDDIIERLGGVEKSGIVVQRGIEIEEWDWKKLDISSAVLHKAAKSVKKIRLWSSGNHSVLRDWSGCDGLNQLDFVSLSF